MGTTRSFSQAILASGVLLLACTIAVHSTGAFASNTQASANSTTCQGPHNHGKFVPVCIVEHSDISAASVKTPGVYINEPDAR